MQTPQEPFLFQFLSLLCHPNVPILLEMLMKLLDGNKSKWHEWHTLQPTHPLGKNRRLESLRLWWVSGISWHISGSSLSSSQCSFNWFLIGVRLVFVIQMETFWFGDLLFIHGVCDYFNFAAFVIGGYTADVYLGGKYYLETVNAAQNHEVGLGGDWYSGSFVVKASVYTYVCFIYSMIYLLLFQHPLSAKFFLRTTENGLPAKVMHIHVSSIMLAQWFGPSVPSRTACVPLRQPPGCEILDDIIKRCQAWATGNK